jgi:guanylate kinase
MKGNIFVISGPSGVGKGTLCKCLLKAMPELTLSISATSRPQRAEEIHGVDYFFWSPQQFEAHIESGTFLEWARYNGNYYGTPRPAIEELVDTGRSVLMEIDTQGALMVKRIFPEALLIFVEPPSLAELQRRLEGRGTNSPEDIQRRMAIAQEELTLTDQFDAGVVNDNVTTCCEQLQTLLQRAMAKA